MTLDIATRDFLARVAAVASKPRHLMTPTEARTAFFGLRSLLAEGPKMMDVRPLSIPVDNGVIQGRLFTPNEQPSALLVYFHGGGWVVGSLEEFDPLCREIAAGAGIAVALIEYRKAPEHPFPIPANDAWAALNWIAERRLELLGREVPLLVGGDSAGANLAISVTFRARDQSSPSLAGQLLIYPVTDCNFNRASYVDPDNQLMLNLETMKWYWSHYVWKEEERLSRLASPYREEDLRGLPPAVVVTAEHDVLRDEGEEYARRLQEAGVEVASRRFDGQMHGFLMMLGILPGSDEGIRYVCAALRNALTKTGTLV